MNLLTDSSGLRMKRSWRFLAIKTEGPPSRGDHHESGDRIFCGCRLRQLSEQCSAEKLDSLAINCFMQCLPWHEGVIHPVRVAYGGRLDPVQRQRLQAFGYEPLPSTSLP